MKKLFMLVSMLSFMPAYSQERSSQEELRSSREAERSSFSPADKRRIAKYGQQYVKNIRNQKRDEKQNRH